MGEISLTALKGFTTIARTEDHTPLALRIARYPDGREQLQYAYRWSEGLQAGIAWRDVPVVPVDENGEALA